ncbi:hypothetical protein [Laspinema olomoucense]|uniref:Nif11 domain-containing protein n=1 Tax=Laspinema olomoucense D3b TaxID=2953688 RepID=A0ABT2NFU8_9CYAN|nr:hypothetical protein [Laspinema sp. D3b]MCT7981578.1 hypothetical protein [Laspinema sp. D3b]
MNFPPKLNPFFTLKNLDYSEMLDLLLTATGAAKHCHQSGDKTRTMQNALEDADGIREEFSGIQETDEFLALTLTEEEWVNLAAAVSSRMTECFTPF